MLYAKWTPRARARARARARVTAASAQGRERRPVTTSELEARNTCHRTSSSTASTTASVGISELVRLIGTFMLDVPSSLPATELQLEPDDAASAQTTHTWPCAHMM